VASGFRERKPLLGNKGRLEIEDDSAGEAVETFAIRVEARGRRAVLQIGSGHRASVSVERAAGSRSRWKRILGLEVRLVDNPPRAVAAFEGTVHEVCDRPVGAASLEARVRNLWDALSLADADRRKPPRGRVARPVPPPPASDWPALSDPFLTDVVQAFGRRRKAMAHGLGFEIKAETREADGQESLWVYGRPPSARRILVLQFQPARRASLWVQSSGNRDRGKVLLRIEGMRLAGRPARLVELYQQTVGAIGEPVAAKDLSAAVRTLWATAALEVAAR
jgi:hypothetical protein